MHVSARLVGSESLGVRSTGEKTLRLKDANEGDEMGFTERWRGQVSFYNLV